MAFDGNGIARKPEETDEDSNLGDGWLDELTIKDQRHALGRNKIFNEEVQINLIVQSPRTTNSVTLQKQ